MHGVSSTAFGVLAASAVLLALATPSNGLSFELCNNYGSEWVTDSPHLTGKFPYYSLIFSCMGEPPAMHTLSVEAKMCILSLTFNMHKDLSSLY
jgi:hypothetical protein